MSCRLVIAVPFLFLGSVPSVVAQETPALLKEIQAIGKQGIGSPAARAAWDKVVARGPGAIPLILEAMDTADTVVANWLRTAFERIVETERGKSGLQGSKGIDAEALLAFVKDPKRQGRARRLALELLDQVRPGSSAGLIPGWLDDPEFRYEAVASLEKEAVAFAKAGNKEKALAAYRQAFAAARDVPQAQALARHLKDAGVEVSIALHFGFLTDWYVIGPFDARNMKGFKTVYPPEAKVDLAAELPGKEGMVKWKRHRVRETPSSAPARVALVNLLEPLGEHYDCVAYAYTAITVKEPGEFEFRGAADDNLTVWVNGKREFGFEEYRNGVRLDRHRFQVKLQAGVNTVLVKICQAPVDPTSNEPNWEFLLRVVDPTGKGIAIKSSLPGEK